MGVGKAVVFSFSLYCPCFFCRLGNLQHKERKSVVRVSAGRRSEFVFILGSRFLLRNLAL